MREIFTYMHSFSKAHLFFNKTRSFFSQKNLITPKFYAYWAKTNKDVNEAQKLRYEVFAKEMSANIPGRIDKDKFDEYCHHLMIKDSYTRKIVGTYRVLTSENKNKIGSFYTESEFFIDASLHDLNVVELGRACVHKNYRNAGVIACLWSELGKFMIANNYQKIIGCSSISLLDGGEYASSVYNYLIRQNKINYNYNVKPKKPFNFSKKIIDEKVQLPPLFKGYLRLGAEICGQPAHDPYFKTADFFTIFNIKSINKKYEKRFLK